MKKNLIAFGGGGKGGGGKARTPREDPDSLHGEAKARVIELLGEGEIYGPWHGGDGLQDLILDGTRVKNADGTVNLPGITAIFRAGTPMQEPLPGFPASESTVNMGVELKQSAPIIREITNTQLSAVLVNLSFTIFKVLENGDRVGDYIDYAIDVSTDGGPYVETIRAVANGKTTSIYPRTHRVELPRANTNWRLRVRRITADSTSDLVTTQSILSSYVDVIDAKLRYPMSAVVGITIPSSLYNSIPTRAFHVGGRIIRVPSNYDAFSHTYVGDWNGTFKLSWSNNPAWILYDLVLAKRYGLGELIPEGLMDKWSLYQIGQYCDELVPDGHGIGGFEPRFTMNTQIQQEAEAYRVIQNIASVFRGMSYAMSGGITTMADIPSSPADEYLFSNSNIIGGMFEYGGTSLRSRFTVALVSWSDMSDMGRQKVEPVVDRESLALYGFRQTEISAFACTSQGQAQRVGRWALMTAQLETRTVVFPVALSRAKVMPGRIIRVADRNLAGQRIGGRISSATAGAVIVDAKTDVMVGSKLIVVMPNGTTEERTIIDTIDRPGGRQELRVGTPFSLAPQPETQWQVESTLLSYQTFRVISVMNKGKNQAEISAVQHTPGKYVAIDSNTRIETKPITNIPPSVQPAPAGVRISSYSVIDQGFASHNATIEWDSVQDAVSYEVQWRRDNSDWVSMPSQGGTSVDIPNIYAGLYVARVRAVNALGISSFWRASLETLLTGDVGDPPSLTFLTTTSLVMGIGLQWGFPTGPLAVGRTEIWYSPTSSRADAIKLGDFSFPQNTHTMYGLAAGQQFWFWGRLTDRNGVVGPFYPIGAGVMGESSRDASLILDYLAGQVGESQLGQQLLDRLKGIEFDLSDLLSEVGLNDGAIKELIDSTEQLGDDLLKEAKDRLAQYNGIVVDLTKVQNDIIAQQQALLAEAQARLQGDQKLATDLLKETNDRIAAINTTLGAVQQVQSQVEAQATQIAANATAIGKEVTDRLESVSSLNDSLSNRMDTMDAQIAGILGTEEYSPTKQYAAGDLVTYNGKLYRATEATLGNNPDNEAYWDLIGNYSSLGEAVGELATRVTTVEMVVDGQGTRLTAVEAQSATSASKVATLETASAAQATRLTTLETASGQQASKIATLETTTAQQATQLTTLSTTVGNQGTSITNLQTTTASLATRATTLEAAVANLNSSGEAASASIRELQEVAADYAYAISELRADMGDADGEMTEVRRVTASMAISIETLRVTSGANSSQIQTILTVQADQASRLTTVETVNGQQNTKISTLETTTAQQATRLTTLETASGQQASKIATLETTTAQQATQLTTLSTTVGNQGTSITNLQQTSASLAQRITTLEAGEEGSNSAIIQLQEVTATHTQQIGQLSTTVGQQTSKITNLETTTAAQATQLNNLSTTVGGQGTAITNLQTTTANQGTRLATMETTVGQNSTKISTLETTTAAMAQRLSTVETTVGQNTTKISTLETTTAAMASRLTTVEASAADSASKVTQLIQVTADYAVMISELFSSVGDNDGSITEMTRVTAEQAQRLLRLEVTSGGYGSVITELQTVTAANAARLTTVETRTATAESKISTLETTSAAQATRLATLETTSGNQSTAITNLQTTTATQATQIATLTASDGENKTAITNLQTVTATHTTQLTTLTASDAANTSKITDLQKVTADTTMWVSQLMSDVGDADGSITQLQETAAGLARTTTYLAASTGANTAAIKTVSETLTSELQAQASQISALTTTVGNHTTLISQQATGLSTANQAIATLRTDMVAATGQNTAAINNLATVVTDNNTATVTRLDSMTAQIGDNYAAIEDLSQVMVDQDGKLEAMRSIKLGVMQDGTYYAVGMGLSIENTPSGMQTQVIFMADRFGVINTANGQTISPFMIDNGQVFMNDVFIKQLSADKINFGFMKGDRIEVGSLNADRIWTPSLVATLATIDTAYIKTAVIEDAAITTLKVAGNSVTVGQTHAHGGMYVNSQQSNWQLFGFYTTWIAYPCDIMAFLNGWTSLDSLNFSYSKGFEFRMKHEQTGREYNCLKSASVPQTYGENSGVAEPVAVPGCPAGDNTFTVFVRSTFARREVNSGVTLNPDNPSRVEVPYSCTAAFNLFVLARMR